MHILQLLSSEIFKHKDIDASVLLALDKVHTHFHDFYEIEFIASGSGTYVIDGKSYAFCKGSLFFMSPASFHQINFSEPTEVLNLMFVADACNKSLLYNFFYNRSSIVYNINSDVDFFFIKMMHNNIIDTFDKDSSLIITSTYLDSILAKLIMLLDEAVSSQTILPSPIQDAILYIQNHFTEPLTLSHLAGIANLNPNYFSSKFHEYTGIPFKSYLINIRFAYTKKLLLYTDLSIVDICYESGFNDFSHFMTLFKKHFGVTPKQFRNNWGIIYR